MTPRSLLQEELTRRCAKNPKYSLRAFSKALGMSPTVLSLVMSGKRPLSKKAIEKVCAALGLNPEEKLELVRNREFVSGSPGSPVLKVQQMSLDTFAVISDWYHYAILSLLETPGGSVDPTWISARLGITTFEARAAIERLNRLGLIREEDGTWKQTGGAIRINDESSTAGTRKFHRQLLEKALESLENDSPDRRDISSMTMAVDPQLVFEAARRIKKFRRAMGEEFDGKGSPGEVYNLTIQFYPVSRSPKRVIKQKEK